MVAFDISNVVGEMDVNASFYQSIKINIIGYIFFLFLGLVLLFLPFDEFIREQLHLQFVTLYTNYIVLLVSLFSLFVYYRFVVNFTIITVYSTICIIFFINTALAPYADLKWLINQMGFILISITAFIFFSSLSYITLKKSETLFFIFAFVCWSLLCIASIYLLFKYFLLFKRAIESGDFNSFIAQLYNDFLWEKQSIGDLAIMCYSAMFSFSGRRVRKLILLFLFFISLPLIFGIRTFWVAIVFATFLVSLKSRKSWLFIIFLFFFFFLAVFKKLLSIEDWVQIDIRVLNFLTMLYIVKHYIFGVGLGGFDNFVIKNYDFILSKFWFASIYYQKMSSATESDIVGVFSQLGIPLGLAFYGINLGLFLKALKFFNKIDESLSKFILFYFIAFIISGICQDNMFTLKYWVIFGLTLGVLYNPDYRFVIENYKTFNCNRKIYIQMYKNFYKF